MPDALEFPAALGLVESAVQRPGIARLLGAAAAWVAQGEGALPVDELKPVLRILVESVPRLYDPLSRRQAGRLFAAVLARGGKTCHEGSLAMLMQCSKKVGDPSAVALLFKWSCELAALAALPEGGVLQGPAFPKLVALQCQLLARVGRGDASKLTAGCVAKVGALFARFKDSHMRYLEVISAATEEAEVEGGVRMLAAYFGHKSRATDDAFKPLKEALIKSYNKNVLQATQGSKGRKASASMSMAFEGLMRWLTHEELAEMMSEITRILRRTPEYLMASLAISLSHLTIDTSRYIEPMIEPISERVLQDGLREVCVDLVSALARQSSDVSAVLPLGSSLNKVLMTKTKSWQDKVTISTCLCDLLTLCKGKGIVPLAEEILPGLTTQTDKEAKEEVKCAGLKLLGLCCFRADKCPADFFKVVNKCLETGADAVRRAALRALGDATRSTGARAAAIEMVGGLVKLAQTAEKKPAYRPNALSALRLLLVLMQVDSTASTKWSEAKLWLLLLSKDSYFASLCNDENATADELLALVEVIEALIKDHKDVLVACKLPEEKEAPYALLALALTHPIYAVHKAASNLVARLASEPQFIELTIHHLYQLMLATANSPRPVAEGPSPTHASVCFSRAILACTPGGKVPVGVVAKLLLLTHSDTMMTGPMPRAKGGLPSVWARLERTNSTDSSKPMKQMLREQTEPLCAELLSPQGTQSEDARQRRAALRVLGTLAREDLDTVLPKVMNFMSDDLDPDPLLSFTARDVAIFYTPEGELAKNSEFDSGYVCEVRQDANDTRHLSKAERKLYGDLAKELGGSTKKAEKPKMTKQEQEVFNGRLAEEAQIRANVTDVLMRARAATDAVQAMCDSNPSGAHDHLGRLSAAVMAMAPSPLMSESMPGLIASLTKCCRPQLPVIVGDALFLVHAAVEGREKEQLAMTRKAVETISARVREMGLLESGSFMLIFPLLRHALTTPAIGAETLEAAMEMVALHSRQPGIELEPVIAVLMEVMAKNAKLRKSANESLLRLSASLQPVKVGELLEGGLSAVAAVRAACLEGLARVQGLPGESPHVYLHSTLVLLAHDADEAICAKAKELVERCGFGIEELDWSQLVECLSHEQADVRKAAGLALASYVEVDAAATAAEVVGKLKGLYVDNKGFEGNVFTRSGVALALAAVAPHITKRELIVLMPFLVSDKEQGLSDPDEDVRGQMTQAALKMLEIHGEGSMELLHPMLQNQLNKPDTGTWQGDLLREGTVILLATLAKYLPKGDPKVKEVLDRLFYALGTPSESVQRSASTAMSPLVKMLDNPEQGKAMIADMMHMLLEGETYGDRRGAAFGLAGLVKGLGISALKAHEVMTTLQAAAADKKQTHRRQGALFGFECLSEQLGRLFEPYVIHILPILLTSCSDNDDGVREAGEAAAKSVMAQLSGQGVKLVMPALLQGVEDSAWKTKKAAIDLLGSMAHCAPRQLGTCLPTIVPVMADAVSDSKAQVRDAAKASLSQVGDVIKNPEIKAIAKIIINSLSDPELTAKALEVVIDTTFVNAVDAASLALLVPVIQRGLKHRSTELKKKAATIVGNMCNLVADAKDVSPYLPDLLPIIKTSILDPSPEMRLTAAQALGSLVKSIGDDDYAELEKYLLFTMKSDANQVERAGAALGLAEVLGNCSMQRFESVIDEVLMQCSAKLQFVREGYFGLLANLPAAMGDKLEPYIPKLLPVMLQGLSDETENVRTIALKAGHGMVDNYADTAMPMILPAIEEGLFANEWRIRSSSVHLLGDVLSKITGRNWKIYSQGHGSVDDVDEGTGDRLTENKIAEVLGLERRNRLFAAVYMLRSDVNQSVCIASFQVWKSVVQSQLRTLKAILPVLMDTLIRCLSDPSEEKKHVAGKAMGEMVAKLGDRVLPEVIPILQQGLDADESELKRAGVSLGLSEVIDNCQRQQLVQHLEEVVHTVRKGLCDEADSVRSSAALGFDSLYKSIGQRAIEEVVPTLLHSLDDASANSLEGLRQLLNVRGKIVLPYLIPQLIEPPMTAANARALGALAGVAGDALCSRIPTILGALNDGMEDGDVPEEIAVAAEKVVLAVPADGLRLMLLELLRRLEDTCTPKTRESAARLLCAFCTHTKHDYDEYRVNMIRQIVHLFGDGHDAVLEMAHKCLHALVKALEDGDKKEDDKAPAVSCGLYIETVFDEVKSLAAYADNGGVKGFNRTKGLAPVLPFFLQALMHGATPETREQAATGLGILVSSTSEAALKPMVVQMSGPLIRIIGDRFPWQVKAAILKTLALLLARGGVMMKPFLPQLQTTFIKSLAETSAVVRSRAIRALERLVKMSTRVDPLINELLAGIKTAEPNIKITFLQALEVVLGRAGKLATAPVQLSVQNQLTELMSDDDDEVRSAAAGAFGAQSGNVEDDAIPGVIEGLLSRSEEWTKRHGQALALAALVKHAVSAERLSIAPAVAAAAAQAPALIKDDRVPVRSAAAKVYEGMLRILLMAAGADGEHEEEQAELWKALVTLISDTSADVRISAIASVKAVSKTSAGGRLKADVVHVVLVPIFNCLRDKVSVRLV